jgi:hypothetical protein
MLTLKLLKSSIKYDRPNNKLLFRYKINNNQKVLVAQLISRVTCTNTNLPLNIINEIILDKNDPWDEVLDQIYSMIVKWETHEIQEYFKVKGSFYITPLHNN